MLEPVEVTYFNWLCAKVKKTEFPVYFDLLKILYTTEFVVLLPGDSNRAEDGLELRSDFHRETHLPPCPGWDSEGCSLLEMFVAFAGRATFQTDIPETEWFWTFMQNLGLDEYRNVSRGGRPDVERILYDFNWRMYKDNGYGGLFPLRWPKEDQRGVEIWYQFCEYVDEQALI